MFDCDNLDLEFGLSNNLANYLGLISCLRGLKTNRIPFKTLIGLNGSYVQNINKDGGVHLTYFELSFEKKYKKVVLNSSLPHVISFPRLYKKHEGW